MKITFLGTGTSQGIPVIGSNHPVCLSKDPKDKRLRTSALFQWEDKNVAVDCGPDFRMQMINSKCDKLDAIFFTHEHNDHSAGIRGLSKLQQLPIFANRDTVQAVQAKLQRRANWKIFETGKSFEFKLFGSAAGANIISSTL